MSDNRVNIGEVLISTLLYHFASISSKLCLLITIA